jgi:transposase
VDGEDLSGDKKKASAEGGVALFGDEALFKQSGTVCRTWGPRGERVEVRSQPGRKSIGVFGAVTVDHRNPRFHFRFETEHFNHQTFFAFVMQLIRYYRGRKIHFILDAVGYHKSVIAWAKEHPELLEIHLLPVASPELNVTETIWRLTKRTATHNRYFPTLSDLRRTLHRRFNRFQGNPASLRGAVEGW